MRPDPWTAAGLAPSDKFDAEFHTLRPGAGAAAGGGPATDDASPLPDADDPGADDPCAGPRPR